MKKALALLALVALAGCGKKPAATPAADTTAAAPAPAPAAGDSMAGMSHDTMARDTSHQQ